MDELAIVQETREVTAAPGEKGGAAPLGIASRLAHELAARTIGADYFERIGALRRETNEFGVDPFGVDPSWIGAVGVVAAWLYRYYFRVAAFGVENVPDGRVLVIANHSGQIPFDGAMIAAAMLLEGSPPRVPRTMVEKWSATIPWISTMFARTGQVIGLPDNARRLLEHEHAVLVFPEGAPGSNKMYSKAYELQEFGLGFMRLALETRSPVVPVAVIGAEEQYPAIYNFRRLARLIGAPAVPVTPFTWVPLLGLLPLPTKYRIYFGEPLHFDGDADDDDDVIAEKVWLVRSSVEEMVRRGLGERRHVFW
jgi:1-acyl-sn-glycerol-3-phosphate acyltransferase